MKVFVLGAGATGGALAQLLRRRGHEVWCGDRDAQRGRAFVGPDVPCGAACARNRRSLIRAARGCDLLVNTVPAAFNAVTIHAALELGVSYLDLASHLEPDPFRAEQLRFHEQFERRGKLALINAGAAPGLTNLLVARAADALDQVVQVQIRLFEETESSQPISTWSPDVAYDAAISRPRVYRQGSFRLVRRFGEAEWFRFPPPIGNVRVVLVAQDEVATLPHFIPMRDLDVKAGGSDIERLRRWYRQGTLRPSDRRSEQRFPATILPAEVAGRMRQRTLRDAGFAVAVSVTGRRGTGRCEQRCACVFASLRQLRRRGLLTTPIAYAAAECAAAFIKHWPGEVAGVLPPEALPGIVRQHIISDLRRSGFRFSREVST
ncbi:MAG: saccharopine dehydrogenase NADP-binding domain-containing protein [Verrucomicrobiales bacterium]|nr:saccharopine dehydrogenase NADP-binding domain-containing protein [Verrucomicrobiales bacterium]